MNTVDVKINDIFSDFVKSKDFITKIFISALAINNIENILIGLSGYFITNKKNIPSLITPNFEIVQFINKQKNLVKKDENLYIGYYGERFYNNELSSRYINFCKTVARDFLNIAKNYLTIYIDHFSKRLINEEKLINNSLTKSRLGDLIGEIEITYNIILSSNNIEIIGTQIRNLMQQIIYVIGARSVLENGITKILFWWTMFYKIYGYGEKCIINI